MKKNNRALAFILTLLLIAAFPAAAFAETADEGTIGGGSEIVDVTLNVLLPTNLNFSLDPFGVESEENQVDPTTDYFFVNQTFAPVKVELGITANLSGSAVLVGSESDVSPDDPTAILKKIYFAALGAKETTGESIYVVDEDTTSSAVFTSTSAVYDYTSAAATRVPFAPSGDGTASGSAVIAFALGAAEESTVTDGAVSALADNDAGVAAFQFYAAMNTYAEWADDDIKVSGAYTLTPLRTTTYTGYADDIIAESLNQLETAPPVPPEPTYTGPYFTSGTAQPAASPAGILTFTGTPLEITADALPLPLDLNGETITSIGVGTVAGTSTLTFTVTTDYTITDDVITLTTSRMSTLNGIASGSNRYINIVVDGTTYAILLHQS